VTLWVPKTRPGMLSRRFARPARIRRDGCLLRRSRWSPSNERIVEATNTAKRFDPECARRAVATGVRTLPATGRLRLIAQFRWCITHVRRLAKSAGYGAWTSFRHHKVTTPDEFFGAPTVTEHPKEFPAPKEFGSPLPVGHESVSVFEMAEHAT
jgi:hypothetical protein